jgi:DNA transformation protein
MSKISSDYVEYVKEQLSGLRQLSAKRLFGGLSISADGALFGMIMDNALYFAVDDTTRAQYEAMGSRCFSYQTRKGRVDVKRFYEVPGDLLDDSERLLELASVSIETARRRAAAKTTARRPPRAAAKSNRRGA